MPQRAAKIRNFPLADLRAHPEMIVEMLSKADGVSMLLRRDGDNVRLATKTYSDDTLRILAEARAEYAEKEKKGYSRDDAIADFEVFQDEVSRRNQA